MTSKHPSEADLRIREIILEKLRAEPKLDDAGMIVDVHDGEVILKGKADTEEEKHMAEKIAASTPGVVKVVNHLHLGLGLAHAIAVIGAQMSEEMEETETEKEKEKGKESNSEKK